MALSTNKYLMTDDGGGGGLGTIAKNYTSGLVTGAMAGVAGAKNKIKKKPTGTGTSTGIDIDDFEPEEPEYVEPAFDWAAYMAQLRAEQMARAEAAYDRNMERIASAYGSAADSLKGNYDSAVGRLNDARNKSMGEVRGDAEDSLRQAYINNMMTRKNLNQRLSAMGYNGGATESTMSSLENQYGRSRSGINETLNKNISNLNSTYGDNLAQALQAYNSAKANLDLQRMQMEMQAENALNNAEASAVNSTMNIDGSYISALRSALANQGQYSYNPTEATNNYVAGNARQAESASNGNSYAMWMAQQLLSGNNNTANVANYMIAQGIPAQTVQDILAQLGR
jgi:hypothetical protein